MGRKQQNGYFKRQIKDITHEKMWTKGKLNEIN